MRSTANSFHRNRTASSGLPCASVRWARSCPRPIFRANALIVVIAIMAFLACLTLGAVSMIRATASSWQSQISREITIQIKPEDGLDMAAALSKARNLALTFVGTREGTILDDAATARLLEPWLGFGP